MIRIDGDRSLKRKWFAEKLLHQIKDLDVPAKTVSWDNFRITAWQQGDLFGGSVTAPMGVFVICSSPEGIKIAVAESWVGSCTSLVDYHVVRPIGGARSVLYMLVGKVHLDEGVWETVPFPVWLESAYYTVEALNDTAVRNHPCIPAAIPYMSGENIQIVVTDVIEHALTSRRDAFQYDVMGYNSNNGSLNRFTYLHSNLITSSFARFYSRTFCQFEPDWSCTRMPGHIDWRQNVHWTALNKKLVAFVTVRRAKNETTGAVFLYSDGMYLRDVFPEGSIPGVIRDTLLVDFNPGAVAPEYHLGSYSFRSSSGERVYIRASLLGAGSLYPVKYEGQIIGEPWQEVDLMMGTLSPSGFYQDFETWKWQVVLSVTIGAVVHVYNWDQFLELFRSLSTKDISFNESAISFGSLQLIRIMRMMMYFFPWPNATGQFGEVSGASPFIPFDSAMFHGHDDFVYTWTRAKGSVKIGIGGIQAVNLVVPSEVTSNPGVRPEISHAGNGLYFCLCRRIKEPGGEESSILGAYYGSPFSGWTRINDPLEGKLIEVRPVMVSTDLISLIGLVKVTTDDAKSSYRFALFRRDSTSIAETNNSWILLMSVPFDASTTKNNFVLGVFGDHPTVADLLNYPSPSPACPQSMVIPYNQYSGSEP